MIHARFTFFVFSLLLWIAFPGVILAAPSKACRLLMEKLEAAAQGYDLGPLLEIPVLDQRPRGIRAIRAMVARHGMAHLIPATNPKSDLLRRDTELLVGSPVLFSSDFREQRGVEFDEVLFHRGDETDLGNLARSRHLNPLLGFGSLQPLLENKYVQSVFIDSVAPGAVPETRRLSDWLEHPSFAELAPLMIEARAAVEDAIRDFAAAQPVKVEALKPKVRAALEAFFKKQRQRFPGRVVIKSVDGVQTATHGGVIDTAHLEIERWVDEFFFHLRDIAREVAEKNGDLSPTSPDISKGISDLVLKSPHSIFVYDFLSSSHQQIVQDFVDIARTDSGQSLEYRVEFVDGRAVTATPRHAFALHPEAEKKARKLIDSIFKKAPREFSYLTGGADVAIREDGTPVVIELNMGANSGLISPNLAPVYANLFLTKLLGRKTELIRLLDKTFDGGLETQKKFLANSYGFFVEKRMKSKDAVNGILSVADYFRSRYLAKWQKSPTTAGARRLLAEYRELVEAIPPLPGDNEWSWHLAEELRLAMNRTLKAKGFSVIE